MIQRLSYADIRSPQINQNNFKLAVKPLRPSKFLNDFESAPKNFIKEKEVYEIVDYAFPRTSRRRAALGNDKVQQKFEIALPSVQNLSIHSVNQLSHREVTADLKKSEVLHFDKKIENELESINRKIKKIINSNKRQVTFQSSLIVIDEQNKISQVRDPYISNDNQIRRKTIVRHKTLEV
ncbi:unnamed protein product [Paramecium pentaurelia]|uniref:Uncharacterized protein n=1 Tax=Paramecium pentaurelia TaxID=43138 RepID=A0A8S1UUF2_9CILI|nr:unnamed protein product [Paramecium pentaurelia]